jgi:hypothetical protein
MPADDLTSRMARMQAAINLQKSDRTPVSLVMGATFPVRHKGFTQGEYYRDPSIGVRALFDVFDELGGYDAICTGANTPMYENMLNALMKIRVPGKDIPKDDPIQWEEIEVLKVEDYDKIIAQG